MAALKWLVGVMGVLIVIGTVGLVFVVVQRLGAAGRAAEPAAFAPVALGQPPGARIGGIAAAEGRLAVWVRREEGDVVLLLDPRTGRQVGAVSLGR